MTKMHAIEIADGEHGRAGRGLREAAKDAHGEQPKADEKAEL